MNVWGYYLKHSYRVIAIDIIAAEGLQAFCVASLLIANKFEETNLPTLELLSDLTNDVCNAEIIAEADLRILNTLEFRILHANPLLFLQRISTEELETDMHTRTLAKYLTEVTAIDHRFIGVRPSKIAAASFWLSQRCWSKANVQQSSPSVLDILPQT